MAEKRINRDDVAGKDVLDNIGDSAERNTPKVAALKAELLALGEIAKKTKAGIQQANTKEAKSVEELNKLTRIANETAKNKLAVDEELRKEKLRLQEETKKENKLLRDQIALENKQIGTLEKLQIENRQLRAERQKLNLETAKGRARLIQINKTLDNNNAKIRSNSDILKKQRLNVGNYTSAIGKLRGALSQLGLAFGVFSLIRNSFSVIRDFQQAQADLASVLGVSTDKMQALTKQAKELGATTKFTASEVSELQKEYAKLGFTQKEIENVTEATLQLAAATGTELGRSAEVVGSTLRAFGLDSSETQRVVDVMAKSFSSSSLDMEKFATAMAAVAPVAKTAGLNIEETTSLLGTLTDRGIDASTAGTGLRNIFLELSKRGLTFEDAMQKINESTDKNSTAMDLFGKRGATIGVILSETSEQVSTLESKLNEAGGAAEEMAKTQLKTLDGSIALLNSAWEGFILRMDESGGIGEKLRQTIGFLANNLDEIVSVLGTVIKSFVLFKASLLGVKLADRIKEFVSFRKEIRKAGESSVKASSSVKKFGQALKGIGWAAAIAGAQAYLRAIIDAINGNVQYERSLRQVNKQLERGSERAEQRVSARQKELNQALELAKTEEERSKITEKFQQQTKQDIQLVNERKKATLARIEALKQLRDETASAGTSLLEFQKDAAEALGLGDLGTTATFKDLRVEISKAQADLRGQNAALTIYNTELQDSNHSLNVLTNSINQNTGSLDGNADAIKEVNSELTELSAIQDLGPQGTIDFDRLARDIEENQQIEDERARSSARIKVLEAELSGDLDEIQKARISEIEENLRIETQFLLEGTAKRVELERQAELEIQKIRDKGVEDQKKTQQELSALAKQGLELSEALFTKSIDARINKINEEIEASEKQFDSIKNAAQEGSDTAQQSLAAENQAIAQAEVERERLEKRKQAVLAATAFLKSFTANLESGDTSTEAFSKAALTSGAVESFISGLSGFIDGTPGDKTIGETLGSPSISGKDGYIIRADKDERIFNPEQSAGIKGYTNNDVVRAVENDRVRKMIPEFNQLDPSMSVVNEIISVKNEISSLKKIVKDKPVTSHNFEEVTERMFKYTKTIESGRKTTRDIRRFR